MEREDYYWSLDASTSVVGYTLWNSKGNVVEMNYFNLDVDKKIPVEDREIPKANLFKKYTIDFKKRVEKQYNCNIISIFIEEALPSSINVNTVNLLLSMNGMYRFILYEIFDIVVLKLSVHDGRKLFLREFVNVKKNKSGEVVKETLSWPDEWKNSKKIYIQKRVAELLPDFEWKYKRTGNLIDESFDMADSFVTGYSSLKVLGVLN